MTFIGIDNGISGSIGIIEPDNYYFIRTPIFFTRDFHKEKRNINRVNVRALMDYLKLFIEDKYEICIERPFINKIGFSSTISSVRCHEATLIALDLIGSNYNFIDSKEWQKYFFKNCKGTSNLKKASLELGNKLFPKVSNNKHKDRDSLLIAQFCKERYESKM